MTAVPRAKIRGPLLAIVAAAVGVIIARMVWPRLHFDTTSLILFGIAALAWALAYIPVTRLRFGDFEAELAPLVAAFEQKVIASEAAATARAAHGPEKRPGVVYRGDPASDARTEPAMAAAVEEYRAIVGSTVPDREKIASVAALVERLQRDGRADPAARDAIGALQEVRDVVVQGRAETTPQLTSSTLNLSWRLIKTFLGWPFHE